MNKAISYVKRFWRWVRAIDFDELTTNFVLTFAMLMIVCAFVGLVWLVAQLVTGKVNITTPAPVTQQECLSQGGTFTQISDGKSSCTWTGKGR